MATSRDTQGALCLGGLRLVDVARDARIGTPSYVYDLAAIEAEARALDAAFEGAPHLIAYAVKANSAGPIVRALAALGCGADVVSGGELKVALGCGVAAEKIVYSGVAKTDDEIDLAIHAGEHGIHALQLESVEELLRVEARARASARQAQVAIRVNPGVDKEAVATHAHVTTGHDEAKFGVARDDVAAALSLANRSKHVALVGISTHVGSQLTATEAYVTAGRVVFEVARAARERGAALRFVGTGGGFGIDYGDGCAAKPADFVHAIRAEQRAAGLDDLALHVEPGRALVAAHGVLLAKVIQTKRATQGSKEHDVDGAPANAANATSAASATNAASATGWLILDAGMNDLLRPALYQARHRIVSLEAPRRAPQAYRVVGPVCESADDFGEHGDLAGSGFVAILDAGAYGFTMASEYNGRALPAEAFVRGGRVVALAEREPPEAWVQGRLRVVERTEG
jgi:diaminopimelate decarboxylase